MKRIGITLSIVLATVLMAGSALAGPGQASEQETTKLAVARKALLLQRFDANHNGIIDPAERKALSARRAANRLNRKVKMMFIRLDANHDGFIQRAELRAAKPGK